MRITRDLLHKIARQTVNQRKRSEPDLHAAYLTGSLLYNEPLLGGTTDIDLVLVHKYQAPVKREIEAITPELSLDIFHNIKDDYNQHRQLRQDPRLGYPLTHNHILLFDTDHWLEFIQASVSADFHRPDNVLARVKILLSAARENWFSLTQTPPKKHLNWLHRYLETLEQAANAVSGLIGPPLTTRRFMMTFNDRLETLGVPKFLAGFQGLLGFSEVQAQNLTPWIEAFELDLVHITDKPDFPVHLAPCRQAYYLEAIQALAENNNGHQAVWPLLQTWLDIQLTVPQPSPGVETWESCLETLSLTKKTSSEKNEALDSFLDTAEIIIETWADVYGI
jgi:hypothetical protein